MIKLSVLKNQQIDLYLNSTIGDWVANHIKWNLGMVYRHGNRSESAYQDKFHNFGKYAAISVHWPSIFSQSKIDEYRFFLNVHSGLLPESRGMYPVFWNVFEHTPAGATVHQITSKLDYGPILFREEVAYSEFESCRSVWSKVFELEKRLFIATANLLSNFPDSLPMKKPVGNIGLNRKATEFHHLKSNYDRLNLSKKEYVRLKLALDF